MYNRSEVEGSCGVPIGGPPNNNNNNNVTQIGLHNGPIVSSLTNNVTSPNNNNSNVNGPNGGNQTEDLYTLEAEITELQRENARVESQVLRLRSDINAMESQLKHGDKVSFSLWCCRG